MQLGSFKAVDGTLYGSISTASLHLPRLGLRPVQSDNKRAPAFEVMALNPARRWVQIGALWQDETKADGEIFYHGRVDDPSFAAPLSIALFGDGDGGFNVVWNRQRKRQSDGFGDGDNTAGETTGGDPFGAPESGDSPAPRRARKARRSDSFEGNADDNGKVTEPLNDEVPA